MGTKVIDIIDLDIDVELAASILEKLSLQPAIPDLSESLNILENESALSNLKINDGGECSNEFNVSIKQEFQNECLDGNNVCIKYENNDNIKLENKGYIKLENKEYIKLEKESIKLEDNESIKLENNEFIKFESKDIVNFQAAIKKEDGLSFNFVKTEQSSDSDEDSCEVLERNPDRTKRRSSRKKKNERQPYTINAANLNQQTLRFLSSGRIIQQNVNNKQLLSQEQYATSNIDIASFIDHGISSPESSYSWTDDNHILSPERSHSWTDDYHTCSPEYGYNWSGDYHIPNSDSGYSWTADKNIPSPESGYDTSRSSGIYSPSPSSGVYSPSPPESLDKEKQIQTIVNSLKEVETSLNSSKDQVENYPVFDDICYSSSNFEQLKMFHTEPGHGKLSTRREILGFNDNETQVNVTVSQNNNSNFHSNNFLEELTNNETSNLEIQNINSLIAELESSTSSMPASSLSSDISSKPALKPKERKLSFELNYTAKQQLRSSKHFDDMRRIIEQKKLLSEIKQKEIHRVKIKIIDVEEEDGTENLRRTNLHIAVLNSNIEKVYCLVEAQKKYTLPLFDINIRDACGKTALDYAVQKDMPEVVDYLKENTAVQGVS